MAPNQTQEEMVTIRTVCPKCNQLIILRVPKSKLEESEGGITVIPYEHGDPPHLLVLHVDVNGDVRGSIVYEGIIKEAAEKEKILVDLLNLIGENILAIIAYWVLAGKKIKVNTKDPKLEKAIKVIIRNVLSGKVSDVVDGNTVVIDVAKPKPPSINIEPLKKIFEKIKTEGDSDPSLRILWIKRELERYKKGLMELENMYLTMKKIKKEDILAKLGDYLSYKEALILVNILKEKGYNILKKFDLKELKIKQMFDLI